MKNNKSKKMSPAAIIKLKEYELIEIEKQAKTAGSDINHLIGGNGETPINLDLTFASLIPLEAVFKRLSIKKDALAGDSDFEILQKLIGLYLAEVLIANSGGKWEIYTGKYHTFNKIVIRIGNKFCDPLRIGTALHEAKNAIGYTSGTTLYYFATKLEGLF